MTYLKHMMIGGTAALCSLTAGAAIAAPRPVVLELFTSNSCSSCPPAYQLLNSLPADSGLGPVTLIRLDEHVDYWNQLDWVDSYSSAQYTQRQKSYAREVFGRDKVYTPQLVVDGTREMVGSDESRVRAAIQASATQTQLPVSLTVIPRGRRKLDVDVTLGAPPGSECRLWLALTQDHVVAHVGAGENAGRTLHEDGVVRRLQPIAWVTDKASTDTHYAARLSLPAQAARADLHVVAFVQDNQNHAIIGAASHRIADR